MTVSSDGIYIQVQTLLRRWIWCSATALPQPAWMRFKSSRHHRYEAVQWSPVILKLPDCHYRYEAVDALTDSLRLIDLSHRGGVSCLLSFMEESSAI